MKPTLAADFPTSPYGFPIPALEKTESPRFVLSGNVCYVPSLLRSARDQGAGQGSMRSAGISRVKLSEDPGD